MMDDGLWAGGPAKSRNKNVVLSFVPKSEPTFFVGLFLKKDFHLKGPK